MKYCFTTDVKHLTILKKINKILVLAIRVTTYVTKCLIVRDSFTVSQN